jgi:hypothetical protein
MPLEPGTSLGPYQIQSALGAGAMGEVYRARDSRLNRDVAIKILPPAFSSDPDRLRRFEQEAHALSALNHPNLLAIFDVGVQNGVQFLVAEYLDGETLREILTSRTLRQRRIADYALQLANGLSAAHEKGIVHRDLKPENILVTRDDRVKILDFGLSRQTAPELEAGPSAVTAAPTAAGIVLGTVGYMSPEQVRGLPADPRSDIFSLGTILYELVSGRRAFSGSSGVETMNSILRDDPPDLSPDGNHVTPGLVRIIRRCLEKAPERRFQSASDLAFAIEALSGSPTASVRPTESGHTARPRWWLPAIAIGALGLVAVGWLAGSRTRAPRPAAVSFTRLTFEPLAVFNARFAPDGETVVYSAALEGNQPELFIRRKDAPQAQRLGLTDTALLAVSAKGEMALLTKARFIRHRWFRGTLARMDIGGSAPREVLEGVTDADWTPDGSNLAILHQVGAEQRLEFPIGTPLYRTDGYLTDLRVSPKGDRIAFMEHPAGIDDRGTVCVIDLQGRKTVLTPEFAGEEGLAWAPDGEEIYFSAPLDEPMPRLAVQAVTLAGEIRQVLQVVDYIWIYDVSRSRRFLVANLEERGHVAGRGPGAAAERDLSFLDQSANISITGDGRHVLFTDVSITPNYALVYRSMDGSPAIRLGDGVACDLSRDGKLALSYIPSRPMQLMLYPTGAGQARRFESGAITSYTSARLFRDGSRVLSCGTEPGRAGRCYTQDIAGGAPSPATAEGTSAGVPSPDGRVAIARSTDGTFSLYPLGGGVPLSVQGLTAEDSVIDWTADGAAVLVAQYLTIPTPVERVELTTGRRTRVTELVPADRAGVLVMTNASFSDDGSAYAYSYVRMPSRLAMVDGAR